MTTTLSRQSDVYGRLRTARNWGLAIVLPHKPAHKTVFGSMALRSEMVISLVIYIFAVMGTEVLLSCSKKQWILSREFSPDLHILFLHNQF